MMRRLIAAPALLAAGAVAAVAIAPVAGADNTVEKKKTPRVKVADDFFSPESVKVKKKGKVKFKWANDNTDSHNVTLQSGPKGAKKRDFKSASGTYGVKFTPTFKKPGTYKFNCTFHPETMNVTVKVKKN